MHDGMCWLGRFEALTHRLCRSSPINIEDIGSVHFRMRMPSDDTTDHLMRADVKLGGSSIFVVIARATEGWPFTIENDSDYTFTLHQTVCRNSSLSSLDVN